LKPSQTKSITKIAQGNIWGNNRQISLPSVFVVSGSWNQAAA
jgi:hypothetical protein